MKTTFVKNKTLGILLIFITFSCTTENRQSSKLKFVDPSPRGYSQSVEFYPGNSKMIFISGQIPVDEKGVLVGKDDLRKQTEQVFGNIKSILIKAGGKMENLVKLDCYLTDISRINEFREARDKYINKANPPASTAVQVERLINEEFLLEMDAIAIIDK